MVESKKNPSLTEELKQSFDVARSVQVFVTPPPSDPKEFSQYMKDGLITGGLVLLSLGFIILCQDIVNTLPMLPHNPITGDVSNEVAFVEFCLTFPAIVASTIVLRQATRRIFHTPLKY